MAKRAQTVRHLYFMVVAIITLAISLVSFGFVVYTILDSTVFSSATGNLIQKGAPPSFYVNAKIAPVAAVPVTTAQCASGCTFTDSDKAAFASWKTAYASWSTQSQHANRNRDLVNYLSFLIVAAPLFFWHFRMLRKDNAEIVTEGGSNSAIYSIYFYAAALGTLIVGLVFTALLINTTLKTWVLKDTSTQLKAMYVAPSFEGSQIQTIIDCQTACGFTDVDVKLARQWIADETAFEKAAQAGFSTWQRDFSRSLAAMLVTIPVFWYHWVTIRKESKNNKQLPLTPAIS